MKLYSDEQLVINFLKGDKEALEILIKRYLKPIYSFVLRFVGKNQEAEDITQEVFVKVWRNLKKSTLSLSKGFNPKKGSFKTWIFTIAKNTCFDWLKKKRPILFSELEKEMEGKSFAENIPDTSPLPNELSERIDIDNFLNELLEKLSPKYRTILLLRFNDHFNFREIAEILGESIDTVKTRYRRGIAILTKLLQNREPK